MTDNQNERTREATRAGLTRLLQHYPAEFAAAQAAAAGMLRRIPRDLPTDEEPAHTFRANEEA
jgi:hypothetical protein